MTWTQCTFLQESAAGYLPTSSSDTDQSLPLNGTSTLARFSENEAQTDGFPTCQCGKETLGCSIHPSTPDEWIAFMQDSLARICQSLENRPDLAKELGAGFTEKSCVSLAWYDPATCSWKTYQRSLVTDWEPYSETWPRWGMTVAGSAYAHPMSERRITETDGLLFATPNTMDSLPPKSSTALHREATVTRPGRSQPSNLRDQVVQRHWPTPTVDDSKNATRKSGAFQSLTRLVHMWPTPNASDNRDRGNMSNPSVQRRIEIGKQIGLSTAVKETSSGGTLNPTWVEWLMGFPIGFTGSKDWVTRKSHSKPQQPGDYSEDAE